MLVLFEEHSVDTRSNLNRRAGWRNIEDTGKNDNASCLRQLNSLELL